MAKDKEPDSVEHDKTNLLPVPDSFPVGPQIHSTTIHKGPDTYTSSGWTEKQANQDAGDKYNRGEKDK